MQLIVILIAVLCVFFTDQSIAVTNDSSHPAFRQIVRSSSHRDERQLQTIDHLERSKSGPSFGASIAGNRAVRYNVEDEIQPISSKNEQHIWSPYPLNQNATTILHDDIARNAALKRAQPPSIEDEGQSQAADPRARYHYSRTRLDTNI